METDELTFILKYASENDLEMIERRITHLISTKWSGKSFIKILNNQIEKGSNSFVLFKLFSSLLNKMPYLWYDVSQDDIKNIITNVYKKCRHREIKVLKAIYNRWGRENKFYDVEYFNNFVLKNTRLRRVEGSHKEAIVLTEALFWD